MKEGSAHLHWMCWNSQSSRQRNSGDRGTAASETLFPNQSLHVPVQETISRWTTTTTNLITSHPPLGQTLAPWLMYTGCVQTAHGGGLPALDCTSRAPQCSTTHRVHRFSTLFYPQDSLVTCTKPPCLHMAEGPVTITYHGSEWLRGTHNGKGARVSVAPSAPESCGKT